MATRAATDTHAKACSVDGCDDGKVARGWCNRHYRQWSRTGDPLGTSVVSNDGPCDVDGCETGRHGQSDWCHKHATRARRHGDPEHVDRIFGDDAARFMSYVTSGPAALVPELGVCWTWTGARASGYGRFSVGGKVAAAHRWAYEHWIGPIPDDLVMDHFACDGGPDGCVNPYHVRPVTQGENVRRGILARQMKGLK